MSFEHRLAAGVAAAARPIGVFLGPLVLALTIALVRFTLESRPSA